MAIKKFEFPFICGNGIYPMEVPYLLYSFSLSTFGCNLETIVVDQLQVPILILSGPTVPYKKAFYSLIFKFPNNVD